MCDAFIFASCVKEIINRSASKLEHVS